jgi:hypothetical protein
MTKRVYCDRHDQRWSRPKTCPACLEEENKRLREQLEAATKWNHSVAVCKDHTADIVEHDGCVICRIQELEDEVQTMIEDAAGVDI